MLSEFRVVMRQKRNGRGISYQARVVEVNRIYDEHSRSGLSNIEIWRRHVYPRFFISLRTFYNMLSAPTSVDVEQTRREMEGWLAFTD